MQAISTLLRGGFSVDSLGLENIAHIASYLENHLEAQDGLLGFGETTPNRSLFIRFDRLVYVAPTVLPDADDTAKVTITLNLLGKRTSPDRMLAHFLADGHARTYPGERNSSFSANCNVLSALLHAPNPHQYRVQLIDIVTFLCDSWWDGPVTDKWVSIKD